MTYQYDRQGRISRQIDRNKNIIEYLYNQDNNIVTREKQTAAELKVENTI